MKNFVIAVFFVSLIASVTSVYMFISECNFGWLIGAIWSLFGAYFSGTTWMEIIDPEEETEEEIVIYKRL